MKKILFSAMIGVSAIIAAPSLTHAADATIMSPQAETQEARFSIENMTCATCPITVRKAMGKVDGVISAVADYDSKTATVIFDPAKATVEAIAAASTNAGYPAHPITDAGN